MEIVQGIFQTLTSIAQSFVTMLTGVFQNVVNLIWTPGTGSEGGSLTVLGVFLLIGLATGIVLWAFYFIRSLIRVHRKG